MAVNQALIRDLLLPGLYDVSGSYGAIPAQWDKVFRAALVSEESALPMLSLPVMAAIGAAAVIIKNPTVSRRFWAS